MFEKSEHKFNGIRAFGVNVSGKQQNIFQNMLPEFK
jgi:hypothetical protein